MLKPISFDLLANYNTDSNQVKKLWLEIETHYSNKNRYYHSLTHLENLLVHLTAIKTEIEDWDTLLFSLYYHDIIYDSKSNKNEEKSAEFAKKRLLEIQYPNLKIESCYTQIIATKTHQLNQSQDTNIFTDADLSILGAPSSEYTTYISQIRQEYSIYPDIIYKPGRKKVLHHFLEMERIFKTDYFYSLFEKQARLNIKRELNNT